MSPHRDRAMPMRNQLNIPSRSKKLRVDAPSPSSLEARLVSPSAAQRACSYFSYCPYHSLTLLPDCRSRLVHKPPWKGSTHSLSNRSRTLLVAGHSNPQNGSCQYHGLCVAGSERSVQLRATFALSRPDPRASEFLVRLFDAPVNCHHIRPV
jgi:hypothetical protein